MTDRESEIMAQMAALQAQIERKINDASDTVKRHELLPTRPEAVRLAALAVAELREQMSVLMKELQTITGLSDEVLEAIEQQMRDDKKRASRLDTEDRYWRNEIEKTPTTEYLPDLARAGLENLLAVVPPDWLRDHDPGPVRLGTEFRASPFHIVRNVWIDDTRREHASHRLARMLLVCQDFLRDEPSYDFYSGPMLLAEVAALGNCVAEVRGLSPETERKLESLYAVHSDLVAPTIYELLVGAAFVRAGFGVHMVPATPGRKSPDLRLVNHGVPTAVECKRRLGLTNYELDEAAQVERLYSAVRPILQPAEQNCSIEVTFLEEVSNISAASFSSEVAALLAEKGGSVRSTAWGPCDARHCHRSSQRRPRGSTRPPISTRCSDGPRARIFGMASSAK